MQKVWTDSNIHIHRQAFVEGLTNLSPVVESLWERASSYIVTDGFMDHGYYYLKTKIPDYHDEIDASVFEDWFSQIVNYLPKCAVIVMDNAFYHSREIENPPSSSWKKADLQIWLTRKAIH